MSLSCRQPHRVFGPFPCPFISVLLALAVACGGADESGVTPPLCAGRPMPIIGSTQTVVEGVLSGANENAASSCRLQPRVGGPEQALQLTLDEPTLVTFELDAAFEAVVAVRRACEPETEVACAQLAPQQGQRWSHALEAGSYVVIIDAVGLRAPGGSYTLHVSRNAVPNGALCASAEPLGITDARGFDLRRSQVTNVAGSDAQGEHLRFFAVDVPAGHRLRAHVWPGRATWWPDVQLRSTCDSAAEPTARAVPLRSSAAHQLLLEYLNDTGSDAHGVVVVAGEDTGLEAHVELRVDTRMPSDNERCERAIALTAGAKIELPSAEGDRKFRGCGWHSVSMADAPPPALFYKLVVPPWHQLDATVSDSHGRLSLARSSDCSFPPTTDDESQWRNLTDSPQEIYLRVASCWPQFLPEQVGFSLATSLKPIPRPCPGC